MCSNIHVLVNCSMDVIKLLYNLYLPQFVICFYSPKPTSYIYGSYVTLYLGIFSLIALRYKYMNKDEEHSKDFSPSKRLSLTITFSGNGEQ